MFNYLKIHLGNLSNKSGVLNYLISFKTRKFDSFRLNNLKHTFVNKNNTKFLQKNS